MDGLSSKPRVILLISDHLRFGPVVAAWETVPDEKGWFLLQYRLHNAPEEDPATGLPVIPPDIISLTQSLNDQEITRQFARKGMSSKDFLHGLKEEMLTTYIRPFIDRQTDKILRLALEHDIPVFLQDGPSRVYFREQLTVGREPSEPWFCFTKRPDGSNYVLELFQNDTKVLIGDKGNRLICRNPCWFQAGRRLLHFPDGFDGKKIEPFLKKDSILIPATAEKKYFETFILNTLKTGQVKATGFTVRKIEPERIMELSAEYDWQGHAVLVAWYRYGSKRIMAGRSQEVFIDLKMDDEEVVFYRTERNREWESEMISACLKAGLVKENENTLKLPGHFGPGAPGLYAVVEWVNAHARFLGDNAIMVLSDRSPFSFFTGRVSASIRVEPGEDWFDVRATVFFGDIEVPFVLLRRHILEGIREYQLPGGEVAILPEEWFTRYGDLHYFSQADGDRMRLPLFHAQVVRDLELPADQLLTERLTRLDPVNTPPAVTPGTLKTTLRSYQAEGLQWLKFLHENGFGGCLADDMGLGKTVQALALLLSVNSGEHAASLVVMPASLVHNWRNEIRRFAPSLTVLEHTGLHRMTTPGFFSAADVVLTTYGTLRNDLALFMQYRFMYVILDESQVIKNPAAQVSRAVCQLKAEHRLVLTGTPIENSLTDLWSQFEFLNPGLLGPLTKFQRRFSGRKAESRTTQVQTQEKQENPGEIALTMVPGPDPASERLKKLVAPFILRRTKHDAEPDLPPLSIEELYCEMAEEQKVRYEKERSAVRNEVLQQFDSGRLPETSIVVLKALIRLRQTANHPRLTDEAYTGGSGKFEEIVRVAETLRAEGHKTLIFSSFVKHLNLVAEHFNSAGIPFSMLTGVTVNREKVVSRFREDPSHQFFLISLKAGGTGLNLTEAGYIMMLDPWWNPAAELQAINRAHRIGQDKKVIAFRFITTGTIEEKMLVLQQRKQALSDTFLPSGNPLKDLSRSEIDELFR